ncbi:MAG: hypothetical protein NC346_02405 [Prevotella sp.]|nr:hypothetical protein [Bacteroidales bacterium]MCM1068726.1 hypothetical protein [Prevotella sp.]
MDKIITLPRLQEFLQKCREIFAPMKHKHTAEDILVNVYNIPSLFPPYCNPNLNYDDNGGWPQLLPENIQVVPDDELTYNYMLQNSEERSIFRNESNTMCFLVNNHLSQIVFPLPFLVFATVEEMFDNSIGECFCYLWNPSGLEKWDFVYKTGDDMQYEKFSVDNGDVLGYQDVLNLKNLVRKVVELL